MYSPFGFMSSVKLIISLWYEWFNSLLIAITLISGCWASAQAFFTTLKSLIRQKIALGRLLISCRDISSLLYHGLMVVTTRLASVDPNHAMTYSIISKLSQFYNFFFFWGDFWNQFKHFIYLEHSEGKCPPYRFFLALNLFGVEWPAPHNDL